MSEQDIEPTLDEARGRIEGALSRMAQVVRAKSEEMKLARIAMEERKALSARVNELEEENVRLHDEIARAAVNADGVDPDEVVAMREKLKAMTTDYVNLDRSFALLKEQYGTLQQENEKLVLGSTAGPAANFQALTAASELSAEADGLQEQVSEMAGLLKEAEVALRAERDKRMDAERKLGEAEARLNAMDRTRSDVLAQLDATIADVEELIAREA